MNTTKLVIDGLKMSKYRFSKMIGVSWNTVHFWYCGIYLPSKEHQEKIDAVFSEELKTLLKDNK